MVKRAAFASLGARVDNAASMVAHPLETLIERPIPDLELPSSAGGTFRFRRYIGERPLVLFFYILNGTPG
jgi:hypothetical protein